MPPPPRKPTQNNPSEAGEGDDVRSASFAGAAPDDPERSTDTVAKAKNPLSRDDPERSTETVAKANPLRAGKPPGRAASTQVGRAKARSTRAADDDELAGSQMVDDEADGPEAEADAAAAAAADDGHYDTGSNFEAASEEHGLEAGAQLDGDGLEPFEPEIGARTRVMPEAKEEGEEGDEGDGPAEDEDAAAEPSTSDENATRAGPPFKLEIVEGPDVGVTRRFRGVRMVIGRTAGVDFQLSDQSVSRRHIELIHSDTGVLLRDLGSGNGTRVNKEKVAEKKLEHDDVIAIGKTRIKFIDEVAQFKSLREEADAPKEDDEEGADGDEQSVQMSASLVDEVGAKKGATSADSQAENKEGGAAGKGPRGKKTPTTIGQRLGALPSAAKLGLGVGLSLLAVLLAAFVLLRPPPKALEDPREAEAKQRLEYARQAARERRLADAVQLYEEAEKLKPGIDRIGQLPKLREELKMQQDLAEVRRLLDQAKKATEQVAVAQVRFDDAESLFIKLPVDTVSFEDDRRALKQELHDTKVYYYLERLNEFLGSGDVPNAEAMLARIPPDAQTDPAQKIADFKRQLEAAEGEERLDEKRRRANAAAAAAARRREALTLAFAVVERKFISGDWERAASECNRVIDTNPTDAEILKMAKTYKGLIPLFGKAYEEGLKKYRAKQYVDAARPLQEADRALRQMQFSTDRYHSEIGLMLVESMVAKGNDSYSRENLLEAISAYRDVLRLEPDHPRARQGVSDVQSRCDEFFRTAYGLKEIDTGRAIRMLKMVKEICPEGSNARIGAENQLQALQQMPP